MQILLLANKFGAGLELRFLNSKCVDSDVRAPCSGARAKVAAAVF
jgi:hypothetical protein